MTKETFQFETSLCVDSFYVDNGDYSDDKQAAFELASGEFGVEKASEQAADEFKGITGEDPEFVSVTHLEFDSNNLSHAGSHYLVVVKTERATMQKFIVEWFGDGDSVEEYFHDLEPKLL